MFLCLIKNNELTFSKSYIVIALTYFKEAVCGKCTLPVIANLREDFQTSWTHSGHPRMALAADERSEKSLITSLVPWYVAFLGSL